MTPIRVLIADDDDYVRQAVHSLLADDSRFYVVSSSHATGLGVAEFAAREHIDVALLDIRMPGVDGIEAALELQRLCPGTKIVLMTNFDQRDDAVNGVRAGAIGHVLKRDIATDLIPALLQAMQGQWSVSASAMGHVLAATQGPEHLRAQIRAELIFEQLTQMQRVAVWLMRDGLTYSEIAEQLHIGPDTVKKHLSGAYAKAGVRGRVEFLKAIAALPAEYML